MEGYINTFAPHVMPAAQSTLLLNFLLLQAQEALSAAWARLANRAAPKSRAAERAQAVNAARRRLAAFDWLAVHRKANNRKVPRP
jgi:Na+-transporting methylmalonyl-CoA/oxaloacetate decarboxylase gamma subunit